MNKIRFIKILFILLILDSCMVETAKRNKKQFLTIYSDCLSKKNIHLFKSFEKEEKINNNILYFDTDSLLNKIEKEGYNCKADLIILNSMYSMQKVNYKKLLQPWKSDKIVTNVPNFLKSSTNNWIGIGINPYVLASNDTILIDDRLRMLLRKKNTQIYTDLYNAKDIIPLASHHFLKKYNEKKIEKFLTKIEYRENRDLPKDSIRKNIFLSMYSSIRGDQYLTNKTLINLDKGIYYNLYCTGIIKQSPNYYNAKLFIEYITENKNNERINNYWKTLPIEMEEKKHNYSYQNLPKFINKTKHNQLYSTYSLLERRLINSPINKKVDAQLLTHQ